MEPVLVTREQYDWLVQNHSSWMLHDWLRFNRKWSLAGVKCCGSFSMLVELRFKLRQFS